MRSLMRPTLFWCARIGLLLSVAAWIVGQWWTLSFWMGSKCAHLGSEDWVIVEYGSPTQRSSISGIFGWPNVRVEDYLPPSFGALPHASFRHWHGVFAFATFFAVLKWVYRKRDAVESLFRLTRFGLVVSVAFAVIGQYQIHNLCLTERDWQVFCCVCDRGFIVTLSGHKNFIYNDVGKMAAVEYRDIDRMSYFIKEAWEPGWGNIRRQSEWNFGGFRIVQVKPWGGYFSVRHWFIIGSFALLYILVKCKYRERKEPGAAVLHDSQSQVRFAASETVQIGYVLQGTTNIYSFPIVAARY